MKLIHLAAVTAACVLPLTAQAQSYRVSSQTWGNYQNDYSIQSPLFGSTNGVANTVYGTSAYGGDSQSSGGADTHALPPPVSFTGVWAGDASKGMTTVTANGYARTNWGSNHASASLSGFTAVNQNYNGTFSDVGGQTWPMHFNSNTSANAYSRSTWEELFQMGGGTGTGQFTGSVRVDGKLSVGAAGFSSIDWALTTFSGALVARLTATYDSVSGNWYKSVFSDGAWTSTSGAGALTINEMVIGRYSFEYGSALYLKSELATSVSGNAVSDFSNTVSFTGMALPPGTRVYALSGVAAQPAYGITFTGNGDGTICSTLACATGGGGVGVVPEPSTYALLFSGLGVIGWVVRRAKRQGR